MSELNQEIESAATVLCKSCGLCCSGHLFAWVKLRSPELAPIENLGVDVLREPQHRGFNQPCPLWDGECTIYESPHYPRACKTYKCKLLKKVLEETVSLPQALIVVQNAKDMIREMDSLLPFSSSGNFRDRLVAYLERENADANFRQKAIKLLIFYKDHFGVKDLGEIVEEES